MKMFALSKSIDIGALSCLLVLMGCSPYHHDKYHHGISSKSYLNFPPKLSTTTPHDVDPALLKKDLSVDEVQRLFDILSWQNFIALNWPRDDRGNPLPIESKSGKQAWNGWKEAYEVFQKDGQKPKPWGEFSYPPNFKSMADVERKPLFRTNRMERLRGGDVDDEFKQAFSGPIWDQNGNMVRYEVLINETEFNYLVHNELYNLDGQIKFSKANKKVDFPEASRDKVGAIELKMAWKIIDKSVDIAERFLTQEAYVYDSSSEKYSKALVGLVGMHISLKTQSSPQWVWATFEHVDNTATNPLVEVNGRALKPSFNNPGCQICPINVYPNLRGDYSDSKNVQKNQIQRVLPIPAATEALNKQVQFLLRAKDSVLQHYELVGTQWPTDPSAKPYPVEQHNADNPPKLPEAVTNKSGGMPTPVYLTNMVMETYFQGETDTTLAEGNASFNQTIANGTAWHQIQGFKQYGANNTRILGTESCIGCHYSGSIAVSETMKDGKRTVMFGDPGASDFSWLLQLKAQFKSM